MTSNNIQFGIVALVTESLTYVTGWSGLDRVARTVQEMDYATPETMDILREIYRARQDDIRTKSDTEPSGEVPAEVS
tara:strand:+ start:2094 stop:2324 length:231 start_codon:yes stop_codon:yes gene_type:complete